MQSNKPKGNNVIQKPYSHDAVIAEYNSLLYSYKRVLSYTDIMDIVEIHLRYAVGVITLPHVYTDFTTNVQEVLSLDVFLGVEFTNIDRLFNAVDRFLEEMVRIIMCTEYGFNMVVKEVFSESYIIEYDLVQ